MNLLIKNGTVINADGRSNADVAVSDGKIISVEKNIKPGVQTEIVDASGLLILPGAIDVHTHFELSFGDISSADDFFSGTRAAACGGVTTIIDFVSPEKGESLIKALDKRKNSAVSKICVDYGLHMGLAEVNDSVLAEMAEVVAAGVPSFKVFMTYASRITDEEFTRTLSNAKELNAMVMVHAEEHFALEANRAEFIAAGKTDPWHHYLSRPEEVEADAVKRAIELTEATGATLYIVHLACAEGLEAVTKAQKAQQSTQGGYRIYAETCPQYLNFTCDVYKRPDGRNFVCSPPMKGKESQEALWKSVKQGGLGVENIVSSARVRFPAHTDGAPPSMTTLDETIFSTPKPPFVSIGINTIATDHCPFQTYEKDRGKDDFTKIPNGVMGVENLYPYMLSEANKGNISFERVVELCASNPADIFNLSPAKGGITPGTDADIVLYDPNKDFTISQTNMHSTIDYTIWEGVELKGYPVRTYSRGSLIYNDGEFLGNPGHGRFLKRF